MHDLQSHVELRWLMLKRLENHRSLKLLMYSRQIEECEGLASKSVITSTYAFLIASKSSFLLDKRISTLQYVQEYLINSK